MKNLSVRRVTGGYIYALLFIFPLFTGFKGYAATTFSKLALFWALLLLWALACIFAPKKPKLTRSSTEMRVFAPLCAYLFFCCISALFSPFGSSVLLGAGRYDGIITTFSYFLTFFAAAFFARPHKRYLFAAVAAGALCCLVGVLELLGLNPLGFFPNGYDYYDAGVQFTGSFIGTIGNADLFSAYLCLLLPACCCFYVVSQRRYLWLLAPIALFSFMLLACDVSAGLLACACGALLLPPLIIDSPKRLHRALECAVAVFSALALAVCFHGEKTGGVISLSLHFSLKAAVLIILAVFAVLSRLMLKKRDFSAKALRLFLFALSACALLGGFLAVYFRPPESGSLWELSELLHGRALDSFGSSRIGIWRAVLETVPDRLLIGGGPGTLPLRIDVSFSRFVEESGKMLTAYIDNAHNVYLGILADTGLLSLLCCLTAMAAATVLALKRRSRAALCLISALLCYWIQDFFGLGLFLVSPLMWLCLGLLTSELCKPNVKDDG